VTRIVSAEEARRIAVRAQLLDGSATGVLETVRRIGFLQIDPISTVAPPQYLVLWSRVPGFTAGDLDRLLWEERVLFEWNAYVWPTEDLPLVRARMRRRRGKYTFERRATEFLRVNARFKRLLLRELEQNGPLLARELVDHSVTPRESHGAQRSGSRCGGPEFTERIHDRSQSTREFTHASGSRA
jgi:uncharacterized protein YcaQ